MVGHLIRANAPLNVRIGLRREIGVSPSVLLQLQRSQMLLPQQSRYSTRYVCPSDGLMQLPTHALGGATDPAGQLVTVPPQQGTMSRPINSSASSCIACHRSLERGQRSSS